MSIRARLALGVFLDDGEELRPVARHAGSHEEGGSRFSFDVQVLSTESTPDARTQYIAGPEFSRTIELSDPGLRATTSATSLSLAFGTLGLLVVGLGIVGIVGIVAHRVSTPLRELAEAARAVGDGQLGTRVSARAGGEVGQAITSFNLMSERLTDWCSG